MGLVVEVRLYRADHTNRHVEDITDGLLSASVASDVGREETWSLDADITAELWGDLDPYLDWVAPVLTVWWPDGTVRTGQLGLYMVMDAPETYTELVGTVALDARDPLSLLNRQAFDRPFKRTSGYDKMRAVRDILDEAVLMDGYRGRPRYEVSGPAKDFRRDFERPKNTPRLALCNEILEGTGYYPLWTTAEGVVTTRRRGLGRLRHRQPVRVFPANLPPNQILDDRDARDFGHPGHVVDQLRTSPRSSDQTNEIVIIGDDPWEPKRGDHRIDNPGNNRSSRRELQRERKEARREERRDEREEAQRARHYRRWTRRFPLLHDSATARQVAAAMADELSTNNTTMRVSLLPDPQPEYVRETVALLAWDAHGERRAAGQWAVHRVSWDLEPGSAVMTMDLGRVDDADGLTVAA